MSQKIIIESLAMDLLRVALGLHRGSFNMAKRFQEEAIKRETELEKFPLSPTLKKLIKNSKPVLESANVENAEDLLMYSILFQNHARKYFS
ncbi:hypothetical protein A3A14_00145 [Candidatus Daviesbacteria bacterium RIFCSPLOWO2_01_FULL_43_38]|uniref:HEPN domain-containing protein n=2 Tax=Candidatus Daviesiibacteriota TaxID=1752718 RepID=A0A1F5K489_9BACT|nr:MAG: hypothetical protein A2874_00785 [Candidatus Daviesbacteria bacterium RIFCSPHIGHO2_01_FULL_43_17]OGE35756.1 MAG: hypothetical protein A3E45_00470 [Candidatus Daviesbacteria bacterium RIFCSPHIGHO2_12_FULL_43_11]OGE63441.1 MAG: hypothetical protein A3A14_00145 [Candidatus Daviesbacteria bacterium RIFCSPLOWO2_01_FULL_43_38]OGE69669.1 MAG: hypothetical protein A3J21_03170 [Candidatus Daviesbacteria bacterium RIFCSPLOWO2_02_FULL_43_11]